MKTKTIKRLRISEQRLLSRLEQTNEDTEVAVSEAVAVTAHKLTTANQNELNRMENRISSYKGVNLAASTKFQQQLSNLKEKHRSEIEELTSTHESNIIKKILHQNAMQLSRKAKGYNRQLNSTKTAQTLELSRRQKKYNTKIALLTTELQ